MSDKFRGVCNHGVETSRIWRGPIRDEFSKAEQDIKDHQADGHPCNDCGVQQPGDPGWVDDLIDVGDGS